LRLPTSQMHHLIHHIATENLKKINKLDYELHSMTVPSIRTNNQNTKLSIYLQEG